VDKKVNSIGYPQPLLASWRRNHPKTLIGNGRVHGGGMHKLEPKELANVPADNLAAIVGLS